MGNAYRSVLASGGAATPLTPSNSSPVTMNAGETYTPTKNGKAVESVTNVTPSNSSPASLSTDTIYKPSANGYAITSYTDRTPSSSPSSVSSGSIYKMNGSGYTINNYSSSSKSPSSSGTYFSSGWNYMNSSGYAYSSQPSGGGKSGTTTLNSSSQTTINVGFTIKALWAIRQISESSGRQAFFYDPNYSSKVYAPSLDTYNMPSTKNNYLASISGSSFTWNKTNSSSTYTLYWYAIG